MKQSYLGNTYVNFLLSSASFKTLGKKQNLHVIEIIVIKEARLSPGRMCVGSLRDVTTVADEREIW